MLYCVRSTYKWTEFKYTSGATKDDSTAMNQNTNKTPKIDSKAA